MTTLSVRHTVSDFDTWKSAFDSHEPARRSHGATQHRVVRDGNDIEVLIDFPTVDQARSFTTDPTLKAVMDRAGVVSAPQITFGDTVELVQY